MLATATSGRKPTCARGCWLCVVAAPVALLLALLVASRATGQAPAASEPATDAAAPAQAPTSGAPAQTQAPAIRVSSRLVEVNVVAKDRKGEAVSDLSQGDFTLLDGGKPQKISVFSVQTTHLIPGAGPAPPKDVFTNRFEQEPGVPTSVTVVLIDALNTHILDMAYARRQILKFIAKLQPQDRVAIFGLSNKLAVLQDFTSDQQALIDAVRKSMAGESGDADATDSKASDTGDEGLDQFIDGLDQPMSDFYNRDRALRTAAALTAIANYVGRLPGRKNLIWISSAFPLVINMGAMATTPTAAFGGSGPPAPSTAAGLLNQVDVESFEDQLQAAAQALDDANIAVYPVDARTLTPPNANVDASLRSPPIAQTTRRGQVPPTPVLDVGNTDTMSEIAKRTGGHAFENTNDIAGSIRKALDDSRVTYILGYYPDHDEWNGKFREIKIKVNRPGVNVRYRTGYFAVPDVAPTPVQRRDLLQAALDSPIDSTTIGMTVEAALASAPGSSPSVHMRVRIDPQAIALVPEGDHWNAALDLLIAQWDEKGRLLSAQTRSAEIHLTPSNQEAWEKSGFDIQFDMPLLSGASRMRIADCDEQTGSTGSVTIPIKGLASDSH